jgi:hypothetical protein
MIFGTNRFSPLAAMVSATIVAISQAYGFSRPVSFGPAGRAGVFESGVGGRVDLVSHGCVMPRMFLDGAIAHRRRTGRHRRRDVDGISLEPGDFGS